MYADEEVLYDEGSSDTSENECMDDNFFLEIDGGTSKNNAAEVEKYSFEVFSGEEIIQHMIDCINEVNLIIQLPVAITRILLNHFNWDQQRLIEKYYNDQDKLFEEAHIVNSYKQKDDTSIADSSTNSNQDVSDVTEVYCEICYASLPSSQLTGLECRHRFCKECWNEYLTIKIMKEGIVLSIACAAHNCDILVDNVSVMKLLKEPRVKLRYQHLITNSFVERNKLLRWCPATGCNNAIKVQYVDMKPVTCKCSLTFCFVCGYNYHYPINCKLLRQWLKKLSDDSASTNWIGANTKECPRCYASIEKNGGCNYIRCQKCSHGFCWICMNPWNVHPNAWDRCNKYVETATDIEAKTKKKKCEASLKRYLFYVDRYINHAKSLKLEKQLHSHIQLKVKQMKNMPQNMSWVEMEFLKVAVDVLQECRQTLTYTYVFAFYLKRSNQSEIFEENQKDLEFATETLSGYLEGDIDIENLFNIKQKVQDQYIYCQNRLKVLLEHLHEGYDNDIWEFLDV